jgi:hypothetical protein
MFFIIVLLILISWQYISAKVQCSAWFGSVEELADGRTDCGEVARGGCLVRWELQRENFNCILVRAEKGYIKHGTSLY